MRLIAGETRKKSLFRTEPQGSNRLVERLEQRAPYSELGRRVGSHVELGQRGGGLASRAQQLLGRSDTVEEAGGDRLLWTVHLREDRRAVEVWRREPMPSDLNGEIGKGHADGDLIHADFEPTLGTDANVG